MVSLGARAESAGTAVGNVFQNMATAIGKGGVELEAFAGALGLSGEQLANAFAEDKIGALELFLESLARLDETQAGAVLEELGLGSAEVLKSIGPLSKNMDLYAKSQALANAEVENATALNREFEATLDTFDSQFQILQNNLNGVAKQVGDRILPALTEGIAGISGELQNFLDNSEDLQEVIDSTLETLMDVGEVMAVGGAVYLGVTATSGVVTLLTGGYTALATAATTALTVQTALAKAFPIAAAAAMGYALGELLNSFDAVKIVAISAVDSIIRGFLSAQLQVEKFLLWIKDATIGVDNYQSEVDKLDKQFLRDITIQNQVIATLRKNIAETGKATRETEVNTKAQEDNNEAKSDQKDILDAVNSSLETNNAIVTGKQSPGSVW